LTRLEIANLSSGMNMTLPYGGSLNTDWATMAYVYPAVSVGL
jgi:hypothetical protein